MTTKTATPPAAHRNTRAESDAEPGDLRPTRNDLPEEIRTQIANLLNQRLADCIDLHTQCKQAHWNVRGPNFIALHKLFDRVHGAVGEYADLLAERIAQLGGVAEGTVRLVATRSTLDVYPPTLESGEDHVDALSAALAAFGRSARLCIEEMDDLEDRVSADIVTEITRGVDQWLWFVEAHRTPRRR